MLQGEKALHNSTLTGLAWAIQFIYSYVQPCAIRQLNYPFGYFNPHAESRSAYVVAPFTPLATIFGSCVPRIPRSTGSKGTEITVDTAKAIFQGNVGKYVDTWYSSLPILIYIYLAKEGFMIIREIGWSDRLGWDLIRSLMVFCKLGNFDQ